MALQWIHEPFILTLSLHLKIEKEKHFTLIRDSITRLLRPCIKQLSEADKDLALKAETPQANPFEAITVRWHPGTGIHIQSPAPHALGPGSSSACLGLASPGELSSPPGFLTLYFVTCLRLSASFLISLSGLVSPSFSILSIFLIGFLRTLLFHILSPTSYLHSPVPSLLTLISIDLTQLEDRGQGCPLMPSM